MEESTGTQQEQDATLVGVVITISDADESPRNALRSVLECADYIRPDDLHIVQRGYDSQRPLYRGFAEDVAALKEAQLPITWHSELDARRIRSRAVIHIEPDLDVAESAVATLVRDMADYDNCDHFCVRSRLYLPTLGRYREGAFFYGFLVVIAVLDTLWSVASGNQHHRRVDLRGQIVYATYPDRACLAPHNWAWLVWTRRCWARREDGACQQVPDPKDCGLPFVLRTVKRHTRMGFGVWFVALLAGCFLFGVPWWSVFVSPTTYVGAVPLYRDWRAEWWWMSVGLQFCFAAWCANRRLEYVTNGLLVIHAALFPLYLSLSPLFFVYARFYSSGAVWRAARSARHNNC